MPSLAQELSRAQVRSAAFPAFAALAIGAVLGVAVFAFGGVPITALLDQLHAAEGKLAPEDARKSRGFVLAEDCSIKYDILQVLHSNLGGQGPDHGDEGIVYKCSERKKGAYVRNVLVKVNARSRYEPESARKASKQTDFGLIRVGADEEVNVRFSLWDMEGSPLNVDLLLVTFYDFDQAIHESSTEYVITDDMHPNTAQGYYTEVREKQLHSGPEAFLAWERGGGKDNPMDLTKVMQQQQDKVASLIDHYFDPVEYHDVHHFDTTLGSKLGKSPHGIAFSLHSAVACQKEKLSIPSNGPPSALLPRITILVIAAVSFFGCVACVWLVCFCCFCKGRSQEDPLQTAEVEDPETYMPVAKAPQVKEPAKYTPVSQETMPEEPVNDTPVAKENSLAQGALMEVSQNVPAETDPEVTKEPAQHTLVTQDIVAEKPANNTSGVPEAVAEVLHNEPVVTDPKVTEEPAQRTPAASETVTEDPTNDTFEAEEAPLLPVTEVPQSVPAGAHPEVTEEPAASTPVVQDTSSPSKEPSSQRQLAIPSRPWWRKGLEGSGAQ
mmetsp:Transcript_81020/g.203976  ORF Transcript_81020/g.203976 Transcript_81020/m.203976 type:complete len:552 (+) Transcript_81020:44-1699(+)